MRVTGFRKPATIAYPNSYASAEQIANADGETKLNMYLFNCTLSHTSNHYPLLRAVLHKTLCKIPRE